MADNKNVTQKASNTSDAAVESSFVKKNPVYELLFLVIMLIAVLIAFISAWGYHPISARAPLVVMTPLIILMVFQGIKLLKATDQTYFRDFYEGLVRGKNVDQIKILKFICWMVMLSVLIYITGHYIGSGLFMFILLFFYGKEKLRISLTLSIVATVILFVLFEIVFGIELYRGMIYRFFMGYDVF